MILIASWGSSGSGKTTVALAVASALAKHKRDVLLLSADGKTPALPVLLPTVAGLDGNSSMGPLFSERELKETSLKNRIQRHPKSSHLFCMGYATGETAALSYTPPARETAIRLIQLLGQAPFEFGIVDCDSAPVYDALSLVALEYAQLGLMVLTPDVRGYEYRKAQLGWLGNSDVFHMDRFLKIASPVFPYTPIQEAETLFGGFDYKLPYAPQVAEKMMAGELLTEFHTADAVEFERQIGLLTDRIEETIKDGTV